jgi:NADH:ubiquinone oxidoreductase subunit F (NADH-binding)
LILFYLVSKVGAMTLALARTFAPNLGKVEKKVNPDGTVETVKLSGLRGIGHAGLISKF